VPYRCWTKATRREAGEPRYSANWLAARRAWLEFHAERVTCGDWSIPFTEVNRATLYGVRQFFFIRVSVVELETAKGTFQFGVNPWVDPTPHLPLQLTVQQARLRYSPFSILARVALVVAVLWWCWRYLSGRAA
jgi:hypothetical protein